MKIWLEFYTHEKWDYKPKNEQNDNVDHHNDHPNKHQSSIGIMRSKSQKNISNKYQNSPPINVGCASRAHGKNDHTQIN